MKKSNLSFVLALLALQSGNCFIYQGENKEDTLCYKISDGQIISFYPPKSDKKHPVAPSSSSPVSPTWSQLLESNWTVEVPQFPESVTSVLSLEEIKAENEAAVKAFTESYNKAIAALSEAPAKESKKGATS